MAKRRVFVDTNLLLLWVVGGEDVNMIAKHKRTQQFSVEGYRLFLRQLNQLGSEGLVVTPNVLTETSNLLAQHAEPEKGRLFARLRSTIHESEEVVIASSAAADHPTFPRLGLTDAALLEAITKDRPLLTTDVDLFQEANKYNWGAAYSFQQLR